MVELSRNIFFYNEIRLKDCFESRVFLIFIHFSLILRVYKKKNSSKFPQEIFDNIFQNIEYHLRELGHGDVSVNDKMKTLNKLFYDILLKIDLSDERKLNLNLDVIKKHLFDNIDKKVEILNKTSKYFDNFYNFCFELDRKNMIQGEIKFNN